MRMACFPAMKSVVWFDVNFQGGVDERQLWKPHSPRFIHDAGAVILLEAPRAGKTHPEIILARQGRHPCRAAKSSVMMLAEENA